MTKKPGALYYVTLSMTALYVLLGLFFIFSEFGAQLLPGWKHVALGILFFFYAAYRVMRLRKIREQMDNLS